ncbi:MAG TPA: tRNA (guanosine(37)-N1)-methyltransferase TrmD [Bacillales bacterium]|nr:tRNA (guanosine(37)-N1)-methyltransferase TrmD [Bacillales bacterium]
MKIDVLTLFPEMFAGVLNQSILKKAQEDRKVSFRLTDFREFTENKHRKVDDYPYGGGEGMVLTPQPIFDAVDALSSSESEGKPRIVLMSPQGETFTQRKAKEFAKEDHLLFLCGHYEGYDERIRQELADDEISIGDYVLTGGELASMVVIDSVVRLLAGVLGNELSHQNDSFSDGLLEYPHYTRPADFRGLEVPEVLLSGHHGRIEEWRHYQSLKRTFERRPDLLAERNLTEQEQEWIREMKARSGKAHP